MEYWHTIHTGENPNAKVKHFTLYLMNFACIM